MSKLSSEEREILDAFEKGKLERSGNAVATQRRHQEYAAAMFKKDARINIRLSSKGLRGLQKRALPVHIRRRPGGYAIVSAPAGARQPGRQ